MCTLKQSSMGIEPRVNLATVFAAEEAEAEEAWAENTVSEPVVAFDSLSLDEFARWLDKHEV